MCINLKYFFSYFSARVSYPFGDDVLHALGDAVDVLGEVLRRQALQRVADHAVGVVRELQDERSYVMLKGLNTYRDRLKVW